MEEKRLKVKRVTKERKARGKERPTVILVYFAIALPGASKCANCEFMRLSNEESKVSSRSGEPRAS